MDRRIPALLLAFATFVSGCGAARKCGEAYGACPSGAACLSGGVCATSCAVLDDGGFACPQGGTCQQEPPYCCPDCPCAEIGPFYVCE